MAANRAIALAMLLAGPSILAQARDRPPQDADRRAAATLAKMTAEEKLALIHGPMPSLLEKAKQPVGVPMAAGYIAGVPRLGIPALAETDASLGVSNLNNLRKGDVATAMPSGLAQAATWDVDLVRAGGAMIGSEARAKGFNVMLAGGVNLVRDPRGGRNFEYLGEDPLLAGTLVGAQISGVQSNGIISTIKHFAINPLETGRNVHSVNMAEAPLRESDLLAFQLGIEKGKPGAVMCAYNRVNSAFACQNPFLLNDVLRRDWGFKGFVMSDWGAVHSSEAIVAGLDQQSGEQIDGKRWFSTLMTQAVAEGRVPQSAIDTAALRILRSIYAHGLVDNPVVPGGAIDYDAHALLAQRAAEEGMVLLRNEGAILPLAATARKIVVIGGHADIGVLSGGGSSQVRPVGGFALEVPQKGGARRPSPNVVTARRRHSPRCARPVRMPKSLSLTGRIPRSLPLLLEARISRSCSAKSGRPRASTTRICHWTMMATRWSPPSPTPIPIRSRCWNSVILRPCPGAIRSRASSSAGFPASAAARLSRAC
jgi:beta-glucosidase